MILYGNHLSLNHCSYVYYKHTKENKYFLQKKKIVLYPYNGIQFSKKGYKPLPTTQTNFTDIMLNDRHKRVCIVWFHCITFKNRCPEWFLQVENQRLTGRRPRNFQDARPRHMLCLDLSGGDKGVRIFNMEQHTSDWCILCSSLFVCYISIKKKSRVYIHLVPRKIPLVT